MVPYVWLLLFFLIPFAIVLKISFAEADIAIPPYTALLDWAEGGMLTIKLNFASFMFLLTDSLYAVAYLNSLKIAFVSTVLCLLLGYPMAYGIAKAPNSWRGPLLMMIILPFWTSFLIRVYAWIGILKPEGLLNNFLIWLGIIDTPLQILYTDVSIYIGIVYSYLPFMILPLYATLEKLDDTLLEAAADLGAQTGQGVPGGHPAAVDARHRRRFAAGVHPGGGRVRHPVAAGRTEHADDRRRAVERVLRQPRLAGGVGGGDSAAAVPGRADHAVPVLPGKATGGRKAMMRRSGFVLTMLAFGYAFLYVPIILLIIYSFNESRLVTVWGGWSTKWYVGLLHNQQMLSAAWLSLRIAALSATVSVILGTMAGMAMARFGRFKGRTLFGGMITAPLVMPEVITGLSLLLLFVSLEQFIGWPEGRGMTTITIAHVTFTMAFVAVIVQSRLVSLDELIEEAAMDLGARPAKIFFVITLPIISPAIVSGWLLAFTLSLDDLVIASFVSGPASTTLPMVIFSSVRLGVTPEINALATIIVAIVTTGIIAAGVLMARQERIRRIDEQMAAASNA